MAEIDKINLNIVKTNKISDLNKKNYESNINFNNLIEEMDVSDIEDIDNDIVPSTNEEPGLLEKISDKVNDLLQIFPDYENSFVGSWCTIPGLDTTYIQQGVCQVGNYTLITAYDSNKNSDEKSESVVYVIDNITKECKTVTLDGKFHCGGIAYDEKTNSIYITGSGGKEGGQSCYINRYDAFDFFSGNNEVEATVKIQVDDNNSLKSSASDKSSAAYLTIDDGYIYVGNFADEESTGIIKKYKLDENGVVDPTTLEVIENPYANTQGLCLYEYNGEEYYVFSSSYGKNKKSVINIATLNENGTFETVKTAEFPCMAEQINVNNEGDLLILFESSAKKYASSSLKTIDEVCVIDFEKLIKS